MTAGEQKESKWGPASKKGTDLSSPLLS